MLKRRANDLVFPSTTGRGLRGVAMPKALKAAAGEGLPVHGLRSTFRDWAAEATPYPHEVVEAALAHVNHNETKAASLRADLLERRRQLMAAGAAFASSEANVVLRAATIV